jgi:hypothetical protein
MRTPTLRLLTALVLGCLGCLSAAQSQTSPNQKVATGTVSGRVTLRGKGVQGIGVALRTSERDQRRAALIGTTDAEGNYQISKVPAGQYQAAPIAPTFVIPEMNRSGHEGKLVVLSEGENVVGIDFTLVKAGVITGKVTDAEGKPVVEERLNLMAVDSTNQDVRSRLLDFRTDDRGVYRIFGLAAGRYKVAVGQDNHLGAFGGGRGRRPYKLTFHPDATDFSQATIVEVLEGGETSGIDITVGRFLDGYAASGRIIDGETGQPLAKIRIGVTPRQENRDYGYLPVRSLSSSRGEFRIEGLTPGRYSVVIATQADNDPFADPVPFEVVDRDVDSLIVKTSKGASMTGVVALEGLNEKALLARLYQLRLNVWLQGGSPGFRTWRSTAINPDGSFRLTGLPAGVATVNTLSSVNYEPANDFVILHTEREGIRLTQGIELKGREETSGLRVVVAHGTGVVRGEVVFVNGTTTPGSRLGAQLSRAGESASLRAAEVDSRGRFEIKGMPSGTYWLKIYAYIPGARNQSASQQVNVVDGVVTEVTIKLDLNPVPGSEP